jgi:hypothetical protein
MDFESTAYAISPSGPEFKGYRQASTTSPDFSAAQALRSMRSKP